MSAAPCVRQGADAGCGAVTDSIAENAFSSRAAGLNHSVEIRFGLQIRQIFTIKSSINVKLWTLQPGRTVGDFGYCIRNVAEVMCLFISFPFFAECCV